MFSAETFLAFLAATAVIIVVPGPGQALVVARSLSGGRRAGITTSLGLNTGTLAHTLAAALGISAILATSAVAFSAVKLLGAAYLIYLGIRALTERDRGDATAALAGASRDTLGRVYRRAVVTGLLNPKVAVFFLAFLPQFVAPERGPVVPQFLVLGSIVALGSLAWDVVVASAAASLGHILGRNRTLRRWRQRVMGTMLIGLGVRLATERR